MKKCLLSILLATVLLCACAQQTDNTLQTPESSRLVELTVATEETTVETPAPLATESPAPAPTQTPEPAATPAPTEIPIPEPTAAPTEAPTTEPVAAESQPAQVSMSYGAVPFGKKNRSIRPTHRRSAAVVRLKFYYGESEGDTAW